MKDYKHHTYETALEQIEEIIESLDPDMTVRVNDITSKVKLTGQNGSVRTATIMLLKKYGITYQE